MKNLNNLKTLNNPNILNNLRKWLMKKTTRDMKTNHYYLSSSLKLGREMSVAFREEPSALEGDRRFAVVEECDQHEMTHSSVSPRRAASSPNLGEQLDSATATANSPSKLEGVDAHRADGGVCYKHLKRIAIVLFLLFSFGPLQAQTDQPALRAATPHVTVGGNVYGGGNAAAVSGNTSVLINQSGAVVSNDVYGGGAVATVGISASDSATVTLTNGTVSGDLYGGGHGDAGHAADVNSSVRVTINGGSVTNVFGCNNVKGAPQNTVQVNVLNGTMTNVFGGGNFASYGGTPTVAVFGGTMVNVFGGGNGDSTSNPKIAADVNSAIVNVSGGKISAGIYGGCNAMGTVTTNTAVTVTGGEVGTNTIRANGIFGAGLGQNTVVSGNTEVTIGDVTNLASGPTLFSDVYGGSALGTVSTNTNVTVLSGDITGDIYGGGLGDANNPAKINGVVQINIGLEGSTDPIGEAAFHTYKVGEDLRGARVFGCNNAYGSPQDSVRVDVWKAYRSQTDLASYTASDRSYSIYQVLGGGNKADYKPQNGNVDSRKRAYVHVHGCNNTVEQVFGGSNAAFAQGTHVTIDGGRYREIFGGGNGVHVPANIGKASIILNVKGGRIGYIFNMCNRQGQLAVGADSVKYKRGGGECGDVQEDYHFCGGNYANVVGDVNTTIYCDSVQKNPQSWKFLSLYAGCRLGTIYGDVYLTVEGGVYSEVFGGSQGDPTYAANIRRFPTQEQLNDDSVKYLLPSHYYPDSLEYSLDTRAEFYKAENRGKIGTTAGGNVYLTIKGGEIGNVFGGSDLNGNIEGNIIVKIADDDHTLCPLTINNVYGGSKIAQYRPLDNTITSPVVQLIKGIVNHDVFGGGMGSESDVDDGLVTCNTKVVIPDTADNSIRVNGNIYGGGEKASVGTLTRYSQTDDYTNKYNTYKEDGSAPDAAALARLVTKKDSVVSCAANTGLATVEIRKGTVGPRVLKMPMDSGMVFGGGRGVLGDPTSNNLIPYLNFVGSTAVTITGTAFVKGSVYGGSQNGHVQGNTHVTISGGQIGCGWNPAGATDMAKDLDRAYGDASHPNEWDYSQTTSLYECNAWPYYAPYAPYDPFASKVRVSQDTVAFDQDLFLANTTEGEAYRAALATGVTFYGDGKTSADHGLPIGSDGHTFYGNVFGGGSGYFPYAPGKWLQSAGAVYGNTQVDITGGHILTSVYGGNEMTDVGHYTIANQEPVLTDNTGHCVVNFSGSATLGVPRTLDQITAHPVTCYLFGAGKGDQRVFFNNWTNVGSTKVNVTGGWVYGSVFGGGEDGHVVGNDTVNISGDATKIGTLGTSYVDGNVFGGGRGFSGEALTSGVVGGSITVNITGGTMLGSIYGGGRLASVGTYLVPTTLAGTTTPNPNYGQMHPESNRGNITITISGGTIGNTAEYVYPTTAQKASDGDLRFTTYDGTTNRLVHTKGGNVFAGSMGRVLMMDGTTVNYLWPSLGRAKNTTLTITGGTIKSNVYGGGEMGSVAQNTIVNIQGGTIGTQIPITASAAGLTGGDAYYFGSVYGGGYGSDNSVATLNDSTDVRTGNHLPWTADKLSGRVYGGTTVNVTNGEIMGDVYGGGEMASVGYETPGTKGNTLVNIGRDNSGSLEGSATIHGNVYGANNIAGSPQGNTQVNIYQTARNENQEASYIVDDNTHGAPAYALANVFGGGNRASYAPENGIDGSAKRANVHVYGCANTIEDLFGGGDAAAAHGVVTVVEGGRFDRVFGGGNGEVAAANIGGGGINLTVKAGRIRQLFGGSNEQGSINGPLVTILNGENKDDATCPEVIDEFYAGSNKADITGSLNTTVACGVGKVTRLYGGCNQADITGNVTLTVEGGNYDYIFGGSRGVDQADDPATTDVDEEALGSADISGDVTLNLYGGKSKYVAWPDLDLSVAVYGGSDIKGNIGGKITVNVEDKGNNSCELNMPIIYGAGNLAAYSPQNTSIASPEVNIKNVHGATASAKVRYVFGGGYGSSAKVTANPVINIGDITNQSYIGQVRTNVYGGGNNAVVNGSTSITMTKNNSDVGTIYGGGLNAKVTGSSSVTVEDGKVDVLYGGGEEGDIGGNIDVVIGTTNTSPRVYYVYGGGKKADVNTDDKTGDHTTNHTHITINNGSTMQIYGGGEGSIGESDTSADVYGSVQITIGGGETKSLLSDKNDVPVRSGVYAGCNINGSIHGNSVISLNSGELGEASERLHGVFGGGYGQKTSVKGNVTVNLDGAILYGDLYGGSALGTVNDASTDQTTVNVLSGTIYGDVYGGGLGQADDPNEDGDQSIAATVNGKVYVNVGQIDGSYLDESVTPSVTRGIYSGAAYIRTYDNDTKGGSIYGCNNIKGTPKDSVFVNIFGSAHLPLTEVVDTADTYEEEKYAIYQVFGGGNKADYSPTGDQAITTKVLSCDNTIGRVFGGGNAANATRTILNISGGRFGKVYAGGNGEVTPARVENYVYFGLHGAKKIKVQSDSYNDQGYVPEIGVGSREIEINGDSCGAVSVDDKFIASDNGDFNGDVNYTLTCADGNALNVRNLYCGCNKGDLTGSINVIVEGGKFENVYGGSKGTPSNPADISGNVTLTIKGGTIGNVFGGCNINGTVKGGVTVNIEDAESTDCPLYLTNVYGGGRDAAYTPTTAGSYPKVNIKHIKSGNSIAGDVFGGGYGVDAIVTSNPTVTIGDKDNASYIATITGTVYGGGEQADVDGNTSVTALKANTTIGNIHGGGNLASVSGTSTVTLGASTSLGVGPHVTGDIYGGGRGNNNIGPTIDGAVQVAVYGGSVDGSVYGCNNAKGAPQSTVKVDVYGTDDHPATGYAIANVFGGGNQAAYGGTPDVTVHCPASGDISVGNVYGGGNAAAVAATNVAVYGGNHIDNVYGGGNGQGVASGFTMVTGNALANIYGGTIGNVFGGNNTSGNILGTVTVNIDKQGSCAMDITNVYGGGNLAVYAPNSSDAVGADKYSPYVHLINGEVKNDVFGGGKGSAISVSAGAVTTSNPKVEMSPTGTNTFRVHGNIYGGGELASVGSYTLRNDNYPGDFATGTGKTNVVVTAGKVGPVTLVMPTDKGHVFGAGKGHDPADTTASGNPLIPKLNFVHSTEVTIGGTALVKGSVYGGSENGHVRGNTHVTIQENCQIGAGNGSDERYGDDDWTTQSSLAECNAWPYASPYAPYDKFADDEGNYATGVSADGGRPTGSDGHTFYGMVFGGGSGYWPYQGKCKKPGDTTKDTAIWIRTAGRVEGNTVVDIKGGHILTCAYGGNEMTDVLGSCNVNMSAGTLGVPRTLNEISGHPVTCYLFGAGKGDQRIFFNGWTNVGSVVVNVTGGWIYGSVFGGGEDGHVIGDAEVNISGADTKIGTLGTSYVDGNVFGGGRGFSGEALTAGVVGGDITVNISGGTMLGSIYGGGRLASVGTYLVPTSDPNYGKLITTAGHGGINVTISGGVIGNDAEYVYPNPSDTLSNGSLRFTKYDKDLRLVHTKGGNVFAGSMGRIVGMDGTTKNPRWPSLGRSRSTELTITGGTIKSNVYGGGEMASVAQNTTVRIQGGTIGTSIGTGDNQYYFGSVYGGGYGSSDNALHNNDSVQGQTASANRTQNQATAKVLAGRVFGSTNVYVTAGTIYGDVYGGGEMASVGHETPGANGNTNVYIGTTDNAPNPTYSGDAIIHGNVYGANNLAGTPHGNTNVHIYSTHRETNQEASYTTNDNTHGAPGFALANVFGGGHRADYAPENGSTSSTRSANVHVYGCANTIEDLFGGGDAAASHGTLTIVDGGRFARVFGGGNGEKAEASIGNGGTNLIVRGGVIDSLFGGSNIQGSINGPVNTTLTRSDACPEEIGVFFAGSNLADITGDLETEILCSNPPVLLHEVYGGCNLADITGNVTLSIYGGNYNYIYGGSKGRLADNTVTEKAADIKVYPDNYEVVAKRGTGGTVTLNLYGGNIYKAFGGSNILGNIDGVITVNVTDAGNISCPLYITDLYGGSNLAVYEPKKVNDERITSPLVNVNHIPNGILGNVFGGGKGMESTTYNTDGTNTRENHLKGRSVSNPKVTIGDNVSTHSAQVTGTLVGRVATPAVKDSLVGGNVYGGGEIAEVGGSTMVVMQNANSFVAGNIFGAGKGFVGDSISANVDNDASVVITGGHVNRNVYGGGEISSVGIFTTSGSNHDIEHGLTSVTVTGGQIGPDVVVNTSSNADGNVYGAGLGDAGTREAYGHKHSFAYYNYVNNSSVTIGGTAVVKGSVFGGAEDGHVWRNTSVKIKDGEIGSNLTEAERAEDAEGGSTSIIYTGNVYGGGRGIDESDLSHHHTLTEGRVFGNTYVEVSGGVIHHDVFGGGSLASVGNTIVSVDGSGNAYDMMGNTISGTYTLDTTLDGISDSTHAYRVNDPVTGTGIAHVRICGGRIGYTGHNEGSVFGSGRGLAANSNDVTAEYANLAYTHNTKVYIKDTVIKCMVPVDANVNPLVYNDSVYRVPDIRGAVFGGGANGHVTQNSYVNMSAGVVGGKTLDTYDHLGIAQPTGAADYTTVAPTGFTGTYEALSFYSGIAAADTLTDRYGRLTSGHHTFLGNVYAGGRGVDHNDVNALSRDAGRVYGNAKVEISGGVVYHSVYGGGSMAIVGHYTYPGSEYDIAHMVADAGTGKAIVNITGGRIGTNGRNNGRVYGSSRGLARTDGYYPAMAFVNITDVTIGGDAEVRGAVFGSGENGRVLDSTMVTITGTCEIGNGIRKGADSWINGYVGNVYGGGCGVDLDQNKKPSRRAGWVKNSTHVLVSGGHVHHNVYGGGSLSSVGMDDAVTYSAENGKTGRAWVDVTGGLIGIVNDPADKSKNLYGSVYGAGRGRSGVGIDNGNDWDKETFVSNAVVIINYTDAPSATNYITGNVFGGGNNGHVNNSTYVTVTKGTIGTAGDKGYGSLEGNVFGGSRGEDTYEAYLVKDGYYVTNAGEKTDVAYNKSDRSGVNAYYQTSRTHADSLAVVDSLSRGAGRVSGNSTVIVNAANADDVHILHHVYGGGSMATAGCYGKADADYVAAHPDIELGELYSTDPITGNTTGECRVTITGGTLGTVGRNNGMVFGASRGDIGAPGSIYDTVAYVNKTFVTIGTSGQGTTFDNPVIHGSVYGGGENGHTVGDAEVVIHSGRVGKHSGAETKKQLWAHTYDHTAWLEDSIEALQKWIDNNPSHEHYSDSVTRLNSLTFEMDSILNYLAFCGNVYGGGCGTDKYLDPADGKWKYNSFAGVVFGNATVEMDGGYVERNVYGGGAMANLGRRVVDSYAEFHDSTTTFSLSWPAKIACRKGSGKATVTVTGKARVGYSGKDNGDIFGAARGTAGDRYAMARYANVDTTIVTINIPVPTGYTDATYYGGTDGQLGVNPKDDHTTPLIAGSVYGGAENGHVVRGTNVLLQSGIVGHSIYGGGKGKGTYQTKLKHITDDPDGRWHAGDLDSVATVYSLTAGKVYNNTHVKMTGGRVVRNIYGGGNMASVGKGNYAGGTGDWRPAGYGESWGQAEADANSPLRDTLAHSGHTYVEITGGIVGILNPSKPKNSIKDDLPLGNVFGGCRGEAAPNVSPSLSPRYHYAPAFFSGYVNHTHVIIGDSTTNNAGPRLYGSVYGGGQDGHVRGETDVKVYKGEIGVPYTNSTAATALVGNNELDNLHWVARGNVYGAGSGIGQYTRGDVTNYSTSSGSVTCSTYVYIAGGTIHRNVYGGGSLAAIGPLVLGNAVPGTEHTKSIVIVKGGVIGVDADYNTNAYGGSVYGSSRGLAEVTPDEFSTNWNPFVIIQGTANIAGDVYGGGEIATVKQNTDVKVLGGDVNASVYGGGKGLSGDQYKNHCNVENTYVIIQGGQVHGDVYGGARDGHVITNTNVTVKGTAIIGDEGSPALDDETNQPTGYWELAGNVFGGGEGSGEVAFVDNPDPKKDDTTFTLCKTCGRVGGNTYVNVEGGQLHGSVFGGGRLALTGVDVNGAVTSFVDNITDKYDSVNHGFATVRVTGTATTDGNSTTYSTIIGTPDAAKLLRCDWSVGDVMGAGKGDIDYYWDVDAGRVANSSVTVTGSPVIRGTVFGGGEMAGIGWWKAGGTFYSNTGKSTVVIGTEGGSDNPTIGLAEEFTYNKPADGHEELTDRDVANGENPGAWTMYNDDGTILHTCTGNVFGGSQGDIDRLYPHWVSMGRSRTSEVTINSGTIRGCVFGGSEQGIVVENTHVTVNGGTIGTPNLTIGSSTPYNYGDVYAAGYGCDDESEWGVDDWQSTTEPENDSTAGSIALHIGWNPGLLAGRVFGSSRVDILGGEIYGDVYGGGSFASVGDDKSAGHNASTTLYPVNGTTLVNIGSADQAGDPTKGTTIHGAVYGANNFKGTPFGNTEVHIYSTAHTSDSVVTHGSITVMQGDNYPAELKHVHDDGQAGPDDDILSAEDLTELSQKERLSMVGAFGAKRSALAAVYGGGNKAAHEPLNSNGSTLVYVHYCEENTINEVYGGGNAANTQNNHVVIEGGFFNNVFGGGNGMVSAANVVGTARTEIHGGIINNVYGGSNTNGTIGNTILDIDKEGDCGQIIGNAFGGGNNAPNGGGTITIKCGSNFDNFYAGGSNANVIGDLTLNVQGGVVNNLFGGCKGTDTNAANVTGNVTVNFYGGHIVNLFGGSDVNGNITGTVTVNVDVDPNYSCADGLRLDNICGAGRDAAYTPFDPFRASPLINIKNNQFKKPSGVPTGFFDYSVDVPNYDENGNLATADSAFVKIQDVFGGGLGASAKSTSYPRIVVGGFPMVDPETGRNFERHVRIFGNIYGGGSAAPVVGNTYVAVRDAAIGLDQYPADADSTTAGTIFGGGLGTTARVDGETFIGIYGVTDIRGNVYGGGNAGIVSGSTELQIAAQQQVLVPEFVGYLDTVSTNPLVVKVMGSFQCATLGVRYSYTRDGSTPPVPATPATLYKGPEDDFEFYFPDDIQCIAYLWDEVYQRVDSSMIPSVTAFDRAPAPLISISEGGQVTLNGSVGAKIYYTLDGTEPDLAHVGGENPTKYYGTEFEDDDAGATGAFTPTATQVVKAVANMRGCFLSTVASLTCEAPTVTINGTSCTITGPVGSTLTYTVDGTTPISTMAGSTRPTNPAYTGHDVAPEGHTDSEGRTTVTFTLTGTDDVTVKAVAQKPGYLPSLISAGVYRH